MNNNEEFETFSVDSKDYEAESQDVMELSDEELESIIGGRELPGSQVGISKSNEKQWGNYFFVKHNTVKYRGQRWRVTYFAYRNNKFYNFDLYNPVTNQIANYVPARDVIISVQ